MVFVSGHELAYLVDPYINHLLAQPYDIYDLLEHDHSIYVGVGARVGFIPT